MTAISFVIPVLNEAENIAALHAEIVSVCKKHGYIFEIIVVDDDSRDQTLQVLRSLSPVKVISFRKRFGQTSAMDAGIKKAIHEYVVTMDGDGQNDPADIPALVKHLEENDLDVVSGWRVKRKDSVTKQLVSRTANLLRKLIIDDTIKDSGCSLKIYKRAAFQNLTLYGEMHRFIPALLMIQGYKVGEIKVNHRPRKFGSTKYNWSRSVKGFVDMIAIWFSRKYTFRPLHLLGAMGLFLFALSFVFFGMTIKEFFSGQDLSDTLWLLLTLFTFLTGVIIFLFGLVLDLIMKTYFESNGIAPYQIKLSFENK